MDPAKSPPLNHGRDAASLVLRGRQARIDLGSSPPTPEQAIALTEALASHWPQEPSDAWRDRIAEIFMRFPLPICRDCVDADGIAASKIRDPRSGRVEARQWPPSAPVAREWLNQRRGDLTELAKAGEIAARPVTSPPLAPEREPRTPEQIAHVMQIVEDMKVRCQIDGKPTPAERLLRAERVIERLTRGRE